MEKYSHDKKIFIGIMFICIFLIHLTMNFCNDDIWFSEQLELSSYSNYISDRYYGWTSRLIIESILLIITRLNINIWRLIDTCMTIIGVSVALKLVNKEKNYYINIIGWLCFLCYPILKLSGAGWVATTANYAWCFSLGMVSFLPLINAELREKPSVIQYALSIGCLIYAINQEQMCALILAFHLLYGINELRQKKYSIYNLICIIMSFASIIFIMTCPGNRARVVSETQTWYPEFANLDLFQKIYLGVITTADVLISDKLILFIFSLILTGTVWIYSNKNLSKVVSVIFLIIVNSVTIFKPLLIRVFPFAENYYNILSYQGIPVQDIKSMIVVFTAVICTLFCIIYLVFTVFGTHQLLPLFIFLGGICSRFIMGWSPTVFASGARTAFFLYMALIMVCIFMLNKLYKAGKLTGKTQIIITAFLVLCAAANLGKTLIVNVLS